MDRLTRVACVWVEGFAAAAAERAEPSLRERPVAVVTGTPPAARVVDANAAARERGVRPGLPAAAAVARCPSLVRRPFAPETLTAARQALLEACLAVSPRLEDADAGTVFVDIAGLGRLYGDDDAVGRRLARGARAVGLPARVGIASSRAAARVAARVGPRVHVVPPGAERRVLADVPVAEADLPATIVEALGRWGIATLGMLAALPRDGVATRLGTAGLAAQDAACGIDRALFRPWTPPVFWEEAQGLEWEIDLLPALVQAIGRVLERLCARLAAAHRAADAVDVRLALASGGHHTRAVTLACPMDEPAPIVAVVARALEADPPPAPVVAVAVSASTVPRLARPRGLWQPAAPAARDLATVLARLVTLAGAEHVGAVALADVHRPDAWSLVPFAPPADEPAVAAGEPSLALRRLRPPRPVDVEAQGGRPVAVRGALSTRAAVLACAGPWRISGEWWDADVWARDEWDVELTDGAVCRLVQDAVGRQWLLDAVYD